MTGNLGLEHETFMKAISTAAEHYKQSLAARKDHNVTRHARKQGLTCAVEYEARLENLQQDHVEQEREQDALIARLRAENNELKSQLRKRAFDSPKPSTPGTSSTPKAVSPPPLLHEAASSKDLQTAYSKLLVKFQLVESNFKKAKDLLERRKSEREQWASHTATLQDRLDKLLQTGTIPHSIALEPRQTSATPLRLSEPAAPTTITSLSGVDELSTPRDLAPGLAPPPRPSESPAPVHQTPASTQSEPDEGPEVTLPTLPGNADEREPAIKQEPSSDSLIVVSAQPVRKRKRESGKDEPSSAKIKLEAPADSSPIPRLDRILLNSDDSLDLGDVIQRISTPRKRRDAAQTAEGLTPFTKPQASVSVMQAHPELYAKATPGVVKPSPLTPIDGNRKMRTGLSKHSSTRRAQKDIEHGIGILAEDGISYGLNDTVSHDNAKTPVPKNRLDGLLNALGVSDTRPDLPRSAARMVPNPATSRDDLLMPKPRALPFDRSARASLQYSLADAAESSPLAARRSKSPKKREVNTPPRKLGTLRTKPPSDLKLEDFKINPRANEGVGFAFSDVVRDKSERAALPGCTDPHCCGEEFRALAISQKPNPPLTSEQRREEQRLLEEYLGEHAYQLGAMDKHERHNVWIDAKTHELANKYGKHRHRYSRMRSPPGFWNADFPSTQEIEDEKIEAAKRELRTIEDRRREAMRPGGRWIFRDE